MDDPDRWRWLFLADIDQERTHFRRRREEVVLVFVVAITQQRWRGAPSNDIGIKIKRAREIPRLL
ncbi:hypothetical protein [Rhizobium laguerreae]|uniref:hypothetical protein n=1 Tax=Rhizobium laguerreae TaxID=1076926 RepID=UPI001C918A00|nr:hypothetical protein [Rhizobium laguerreae]MBY3568649.1 hypothetical protein [Rhizobium laguerreae]